MRRDVKDLVEVNFRGQEQLVDPVKSSFTFGDLIDFGFLLGMTVGRGVLHGLGVLGAATVELRAG